MIIKSEQTLHHSGIRDVVKSAFGQADEADLVDQLRAAGDSVISLVALEADEVVGHVLFSRMTAPIRALGLAPVSVRPNRQRAGIGSRLIRAGLERATVAGWQAVFVLGEPTYYRRFGFDPSLASGFRSRYAGPHLMALALGADLAVTTGSIEYAPAFLSLG